MEIVDLSHRLVLWLVNTPKTARLSDAVYFVQKRSTKDIPSIRMFIHFLDRPACLACPTWGIDDFDRIYNKTSFFPSCSAARGFVRRGLHCLFFVMCLLRKDCTFCRSPPLRLIPECVVLFFWTASLPHLSFWKRCFASEPAYPSIHADLFFRKANSLTAL